MKDMEKGDGLIEKEDQKKGNAEDARTTEKLPSDNTINEPTTSVEKVTLETDKNNEENTVSQNVEARESFEKSMQGDDNSCGYEESKVDPAMVELFTSGIIERFLPALRKAQSTVTQVKSSQAVLLETVQQEVAKFKECTAVKDVEDTMTKARHYHNKLIRLRKEMTNLHDKSKKLKKRALKLQQQKQTEELTRAHGRERELERERMLTARVASSNSTST